MARVSNDSSEHHPTPAIAVSGLTKQYGWVPALRGVNLAVAPGTCLALFGPNGAGKSTLIGVLSTLVRPSCGTASVAGFDVRCDGTVVRRHLGVISHHPWVYDRLSVYDNLSFFARLYGVEDIHNRIMQLLGEVGLESWREQDASTLSRGMRQRLTIARALLHDPPVLLLDEPFTGLDRYSARAFSDRLAALRESGRTILLVTHNVEEGWLLSDRAAIMVRGEIRHEQNVKVNGMKEFGEAYDNILQGNRR